jgi:hypothetical protein
MNKVYQLLAHGRWFSPGTPASSTTKTDRHDIAESGIKHQKSIKKINQSMYMNIIYLPLYRLLTNKTYRHDKLKYC